MIRRLSYILANYIYHKKSKNEVQTHADRYVYYYLITLFSFQIFETLLLLLCAWILGCLFPTIVVILCFIPLRSRLGGFHARSQGMCIILSTVIIVGCGLVSKCLASVICVNFIITSIIISIILVLGLRIKIINKTMANIELLLNKLTK
jgi:accessory gene regulator B